MKRMSDDYSAGSIPRDIQAKMPSPKVILNAFWHVTVKVLNSYNREKISCTCRKESKEQYELCSYNFD